jgi:hypothetical protein
MPKGLLCAYPKTTSSSWTIPGHDVSSPCTAIGILRQSQPTAAMVLLVITGWSCAVTACYVTHAKDRAQGIIVLSVWIFSLWLASLTAPDLSTMHVTFWSLTCGLLFGAALHKIWTCLRGNDGLQSKESHSMVLPDMKKGLDVTDV